jgi:hypothetical protein
VAEQQRVDVCTELRQLASDGETFLPKGRRFDTTEQIQAESQRMLDTLTEKTSRKRSKNGRDGGTGVYMWEGTTSRVMAADRPYGEFYDFYSVSPEYFGFTLVCSSAFRLELVTLTCRHSGTTYCRIMRNIGRGRNK